VNHDRLSDHLPSDPRQWVADLAKIWNDRDGRRAAEGFTDDAVLFWGKCQSQSGAALRERPSKWFDFASDLQITKTYIAHTENRIVATWDSAYTHPKSGDSIVERGIEFFVFRSGLVCEQHAWQHSWTADSEASNDGSSSG